MEFYFKHLLMSPQGGIRAILSRNSKLTHVVISDDSDICASCWSSLETTYRHICMWSKWRTRVDMWSAIIEVSTAFLSIISKCDTLLRTCTTAKFPFNVRQWNQSFSYLRAPLRRQTKRVKGNAHKGELVDTWYDIEFNLSFPSLGTQTN